MNKVYFIGIGGIGMSALARYFVHQGDLVAGYDRTPTTLTASLESEGMAIHYQDAVENIPQEFRDDPKITVIYTPAVPADSAELNYFKQSGVTLLKRSKALGHLAAAKRCLAVAGTHGKTTTSTLLAHLLQVGLGGCTAFLGGLSKNYQSNLLLSTNDYLVAEADEYDRSFLQLYPQAAVITSTDADHLDIYGTHDALKQSFSDFGSQVKSDGLLILKQGVQLNQDAIKCKILHYALELDPSKNDRPDYYASQIILSDAGKYTFCIHTPQGIIEDCELGIRGLVNVENAIAATALALYAGVNFEGIRTALRSFSGVKRRFDFHVDTPQLTYIDDYAHHPAELTAAITSIRSIFPGRKLTAIFQPHLFSRTQDFADDFATSLSLVDQLILLDIYPARELPIEGVNAELILNKVGNISKLKCTKAELMSVLAHQEIDVLVSFGAGDIDTLVPDITDYLNKRLL